MAWNEWERLKGEAAARQGADDLRVHQDDLGAVGHEAFTLHEELCRVADVGSAGAQGAGGAGGAGVTWRAAATLRSSGFATGGALATTLEIWSSQVRTVLQATAHISNHLAHSRKAHARDDAEIGALLTGRDGSSAVPVSVLQTYFT
ncbi:hypothetical protein [Streptomyces fragilis]|uniref:AG1 protein n=1 Tax=Streptomyces fragilis TaxID=67301 RepID=A0ABV2YL44_9ACTN|nr:hypothetical protein [Streptomyces fragilis]